MVTFAVTSDDGSRLRIDGVDVTVDDGTHGPKTTRGRLTWTRDRTMWNSHTFNEAEELRSSLR